MSQPSIVASGLSKRFPSKSFEDGWLHALRDVSFEVSEGEAVGLIGPNGAGKSTLLRILARVTRPTAGYADIYGTVGALLEVGTGFHPELTGRENTYLSGAVLGMSRADVRARFDEIVGFAELTQFIDIPVKRYSSGMYARLGFAVAAHLRPSILIVDEVLAVGDLAFQAKCLVRMHQLTSEGTTVLFVSHNLLAVADLCARALLVRDGGLVFDGSSDDAIQAYRRLQVASPTDHGIEDLSVEVNGVRAGPWITVASEETLTLGVVVERGLGAPTVEATLNLLVETPDGRTVVHLRSDHSGSDLVLAPGTTRLGVDIEGLPLSPGFYTLWLRLVSLDSHEPLVRDSQRFTLHVDGANPTGALVDIRHRFHAESADRVRSADRRLP